jgi:hypothetical protein
MKIDEDVQGKIDALLAADPNPKFGGVGTRMLYENDRVRIWEVSLAPGEASDFHKHDVDYVIVQIEGDHVIGVPHPESGLDILDGEIRPGRTRFIPKGGEEWALNVGNDPYREILIELK